MSATAVCEERFQVHRDRRPCALPAGITLGQLLTRAHEGVHSRGTADCPVCGHSMRRAASEAGCEGCGARLF